MNKSKSVFVLLFSITALCLMLPAFSQDSPSPTSSAKQAEQSPAVQQLTDDLNSYTPNYIGVATAKDAFGTENYWEWYWDKNAHITVTRGFFWGDDAISQAFQGFSDRYVVPFWNVVMEPLVVRVLAPVAIIGAVVFSYVRRKKKTEKVEISEPPRN